MIRLYVSASRPRPRAAFVLRCYSNYSILKGIPPVIVFSDLPGGISPMFPLWDPYAVGVFAFPAAERSNGRARVLGLGVCRRYSFL